MKNINAHVEYVLTFVERELACGCVGNCGVLHCSSGEAIEA